MKINIAFEWLEKGLVSPSSCAFTLIKIRECTTSLTVNRLMRHTSNPLNSTSKYTVMYLKQSADHDVMNTPVVGPVPQSPHQC